MKKQVRHAYNRKAMDSDLEKPEGVSLTIPDHTMSIREIVTRFASGRGITSSIKQPIFHGEEVDLPDLKRLDLVEVAQMLENVRENRRLIEHQLDQEKLIQRNLEIAENEKAKKQEDERLLKLYEERLRNQKS